MARTARVAKAAIRARSSMPTPNSTPMAEVIQSEAAVVRPWTEKPLRKITPAQRKPIPVRMPCDIRVGSMTMVWPGRATKAQLFWCMAASMRTHEASATRMWVRKPAGWPW